MATIHKYRAIMHNHEFNWEDLRYVLNVAKKGSVAAAATALGVNRTTVLRRINQFEQTLEFQLFDRRGTGYTLAPGAEQLLGTALEIEQTLHNLHLRIRGKEIQLQGEISVTTTDAILLSTVAPHIASFRTRHPQIRIDLVISNHRLSLSQRDADVAIRPGRSVPPNLVGRKIAELEFGIYAAPEYLQNNPQKDFLEHQWIGINNPLLGSPPGEWFSANIPEQRVCLRTDSFVALRAMAETGLGLALLPVNLGSQSAALQRVFTDQPRVSNNLWAITHPDLQHAARIETFLDHLYQSMNEATGS